jgi:hypothetical protein
LFLLAVKQFLNSKFFSNMTLSLASCCVPSSHLNRSCFFQFSLFSSSIACGAFAFVFIIQANIFIFIFPVPLKTFVGTAIRFFYMHKIFDFLIERSLYFPISNPFAILELILGSPSQVVDSSPLGRLTYYYLLFFEQATTIFFL